MSNTSLRAHWDLDPGVTHLNHGAFGACPRVVLDAQSALRGAIERNPARYFIREHFERLDAARARLAAFLGAEAGGLVVVPNATAGVNAVLRSVDLPAGSEVVVTDHAYNACRNALDYAARRAGATVRTVTIPLPVRDPGEITQIVVSAVRPRTRFALIDHVTSATALVLPVAEISAALSARGVDLLVDGAHAPGMLPLDLDTIGAAYYTGNCHKWLCAPKGAAFLYVRPDRRDAVRPLVIGHGVNRRRPGRSRLHDDFDWAGTADPTPFLCVPVAIDAIAAMLPGGWPEVMQRNHLQVLAARECIRSIAGTGPLCPPEMTGSIACVQLPGPGVSSLDDATRRDPLESRLADLHCIEVPVHAFGDPPRRLLRISAQLYNGRADFDRLAAAMRSELAASMPGLEGGA